VRIHISTTSAKVTSAAYYGVSSQKSRCVVKEAKAEENYQHINQVGGLLTWVMRQSLTYRSCSSSYNPSRSVPFARRTLLSSTQNAVVAHTTASPEANPETNSKKIKTTPSMSIVAQGRDSYDIIKNLCRTMAHCGMQQGACLGVLVDDVQGGQYQVRSQPEQKVVAGEITLSEVLKPGHKPRLTRAQRFQIALKVASSHLQLHSTSWASRQWEAEDVRFPQTGTAGILLDRPFVSASFEDDTPLTPHRPKLADKSFACLGIMLLELLFGTRTEEHELWQQLGIHNAADPLFRLMVAKRWADDVEGEAGPEYFSAEGWCLNKSPSTLEGDQWRQDLAHEVVLPLQHCCEWISPKESR
jgi:hypothetical protein